jgi:hypothetical protein
LLHGASAWIEWDVLGVGCAAGGELRAYVEGAEYYLGAGLGSRQGITWDTTRVPDGLCELRLVFRDADANLLAEFSNRVAINNSVTWHAGALETTATWKADTVHIVESHLTIPNGVTLFIEPGAIVKFVRNIGVTVEDGGTLSAPATFDEPIILTSLGDDTAGGDSNLDGDLTRPRPGDWLGMAAEGAGQLLLSEFVEVRYAVTRHTGILGSSEVWGGTFVHLIPSDLTIPAGVKLTIQPGAVVKLGAKVGITVSAGGEISARVRSRNRWCSLLWRMTHGEETVTATETRPSRCPGTGAGFTWGAPRISTRQGSITEAELRRAIGIKPERFARQGAIPPPPERLCGRECFL